MFDMWQRIEREVMSAKVQARATAVAHERKIERRRNPKSNWSHSRQVLKEICALVTYRHRGPCDTDDGEAYLSAALPWLIEKNEGFEAEDLQERITRWVKVVCPLLNSEAIRLCLTEARRRNERRCLWWTAQRLGDLLCLTIKERERLRITRLRPAGMTTRQFTAYQRSRKAWSAKARRAAKGSKPHEQSAAQLKPWDALRISRSRYYQMKKQGALPGQLRDRETHSSQPGTKYLQPDTPQSHTSEQTVPGPARKARPRHRVGAIGPSPGARTRVVSANPPRALPLPEEGIFEHPDLLGDSGDWRQLGALFTSYEGGVLPPDLAQAVREAQRVRLMTQKALADCVGVSRPQLANALRGRFGLGRRAATSLMEWLMRGRVTTRDLG
ncbi:helix-turn-helix domain-containing protein [Methylobacterium trifolii]|uniref:HTH cro/C1-type domain-containing protein n=1 Tax=Methylobacterium trifolii TaxID=1003092 RepID=A0ABQ4TUY4_9HYPH|nr:hypothetical protein [Methylobacterium trifolii]GJE59099.1 hypothetical protein MPOCJGCO_1186 [Methylobacterium trifolii]